MRPVVILALAVFGLIVAFSGCNSYNRFVNLDEEINKKWGDLQTQYQRRADLIPNLVETVKGAANFEQSTLTEIAEARAQATSLKADISKLTPDQIQEFKSMEGQLSNTIGRLLSITENYPQLQAVQAFRDLVPEISGSENRVAVARKDFNEVVTNYNKSVRKFPSNFWAGIFGFDKKQQFEADQAAQNAPKVDFNSGK